MTKQIEERRSRDERVTVRFTSVEIGAIRRAAERVGVTVGTYLRMQALASIDDADLPS